MFRRRGIRRYSRLTCASSSFTKRTVFPLTVWFQSGLLDQWTQFLVDEALIPANQISTDDFAGSLANQTNLAIKGIVGIRAMAEIASTLNNSTASSNYSVRHTLRP